MCSSDLLESSAKCSLAQNSADFDADGAIRRQISSFQKDIKGVNVVLGSTQLHSIENLMLKTLCLQISEPPCRYMQLYPT